MEETNRAAPKEVQSDSNALLADFCADIRNKLSPFSTLIYLGAKEDKKDFEETIKRVAAQGKMSLAHILRQLEKLESGQVG